MQGVKDLIGSRFSVSIPNSCDLSIEELIKRNMIKEEVEVLCPTHKAHYKAIAKHKFLNYIVYTECPQCAKDREVENKKREAELERERAILKHRAYIEALRDRGCGEDYIKGRDKISYDTPLFMSKLGDCRLVDFLRHKDREFLNTSNLLILGGCGIGKTFFSYRLIDEALKIGKCYKIITAFELVGLYTNSQKDGFSRLNSSENILDFLRGVDCVIIDEIDFIFKDTRSLREKEALEILAHYCYKNSIRTIILGNCSIEELPKYLDRKVLSRFSSGEVVNGWGMQDLRLSK